ncbi:hypothetical protein PYCC9005_003094 [Savitreella phatthalungensis]
MRYSSIPFILLTATAFADSPAPTPSDTPSAEDLWCDASGGKVIVSGTTLVSLGIALTTNTGGPKRVSYYWCTEAGATGGWECLLEASNRYLGMYMVKTTVTPTANAYTITNTTVVDNQGYQAGGGCAVPTKYGGSGKAYG